MELEQAKQRAEELRRVIERNNRLYYMENAPELEDFEYDALTRELKAIEAEYPQLVTPSSPTQHVNEAASSKFSKVAHTVKMESLQDAFSFEELRELTPACGKQASSRSMLWKKRSTAFLSALNIKTDALCAVPHAATAWWGRM